MTRWWKKERGCVWIYFSKAQPLSPESASEQVALCLEDELHSECDMQTAQSGVLRLFHIQGSLWKLEMPWEIENLNTYPWAGLIGSQLKITLRYWKLSKGRRKSPIYPNFKLFPWLTLAITARIILKVSFSRKFIRCQLSFYLPVNM